MGINSQKQPDILLDGSAVAQRIQATSTPLHERIVNVLVDTSEVVKAGGELLGAVASLGVAVAINPPIQIAATLAGTAARIRRDVTDNYTKARYPDGKPPEPRNN